MDKSIITTFVFNALWKSSKTNLRPIVPFLAFALFASSIATSAVVPAAPWFSPGTGTYPYSNGVSVKIADTTSGAQIYYTTDGTTPSVKSTLYTTPIVIPGVPKVETIKAVAILNGVSSYSVATAVYTMDPTPTTPTPVISPASGTYSTPPTVAITDSLQGANIYYTLDGTVPTNKSPLYTGPFLLSSTTTGVRTIQAIAQAASQFQSAVALATVDLVLPPGVIATATLTGAPGLTIATNFLGVSHSWSDAQTLMGSASSGTDPIYANLLSQLAGNMNGPIVIRTVGDTVTGSVTPANTEPFIELARNVNVKFLMGVNLAEDNLPLAEGQAAAFETSIPSQNLMAIEIGNEPDGYGQYGQRPPSYTFANALADYQQWRTGVLQSGPVSIAGPTLGGGVWIPNAVTAVSNGTLRPTFITQHEYLMCYDPSALQPSNYLLQPASAQVHFYTVVPYVTAVHAAGLPFRMDEMNSLCNGGQPGLSNTFSAALWAIDAMFEYVNIGVDGVNWNSSYTGGPYDLFQIETWKPPNGLLTYQLSTVRPLYYGLLFFSRAAGHSARLLPLSTMTNSNLKMWATTDATGKAHLVVINKEQTTAGNVQINLNGYTSGIVTNLSAASGYLATTGVTFGGQTFDSSANGTLQGSLVTQKIIPSGSLWTVAVQPMSAVLVDLLP